MARDEAQLELPELTAYWFRNREGTVVHRARCTVQGERVPWEKARGWTDERMAHAVATLFFLRACGRCAGAVNEMAERLRGTR